MNFEQIVSLLSIIGAVLGFFASAMGAIGLWIVNGIRSDVHNLADKMSGILQKMITREESQDGRDRLRHELGERFDAIDGRIERAESVLFADRTDSNLGAPYPVRKRRESDRER